MKKFAALLLFFFSTDFIHADSAECTRKFPGSVPLETGHRAYAVLGALQLETDIPATPIQLCVWEGDTHTSSINVKRQDTIVIAASRFTLTHFSKAALIGALAHELGHIVRNTHNPNPDAQEIEREDQMADAFAIRLIGAEPLRITYFEHTHDNALAERRIARALKLLKK